MRNLHPQSEHLNAFIKQVPVSCCPVAAFESFHAVSVTLVGGEALPSALRVLLAALVNLYETD